MSDASEHEAKSTGEENSRSLEQEIESLRLHPDDADSLRKMVREAEARIGIPRLNPVTLGRHAPVIRMPIAGVPRTFNAGRMLVIVTMFALLFSLLQWAKAPMPVYPVVGGFCAAIVLGQMLLFGGRQPRAASCIAGGCSMPLIALVIAVFEDGNRLIGELRAAPMDMLSSLACPALGAAVFGVLAGYVIGTFCAGVFLIVDRRWNAGQIVPDVPVDALVLSEDGMEQDSSTPNDYTEGDPWADT